MKCKGMKIHLQKIEAGWCYGYRDYATHSRSYRKHARHESHGNSDNSVMWLGRCKDKKTAVKKVKKLLRYFDRLERAKKRGAIRSVESYFINKLNDKEKGQNWYARYLLFCAFRDRK